MTWGGILGAVVVFTASIAFPVDSYALVNIRSEVSYQSNKTYGNVKNNNGYDKKYDSSVLERFSVILNNESQFSTKLRMTGIYRFDIVKRDQSGGAKSTELQPYIDLKFSTNALQLETGYRQILRDETIVSGTNTISATDKTSEAVADATVKKGTLPDIRMRYDNRDSRRDEDGSLKTETSTQEFRGSMNYKLGIFSMNADFNKRTEKDTNPVTFSNVSGVPLYTRNVVNTTDQTDISGQLFVNKKFSNKVTASVRENFLVSNINNSDPSKDVKRTNTTSEFRIILTPVVRSMVNSSYIITRQKNNDQYTDQNTWVTSASYTMARFFRFYGSFLSMDTDQDQNASSNSTVLDTTILGVNFKHTIGNINITARYERRSDDINSNATDTGTGKNADTQNTRTNIDWLIDTVLTRYLSVSLSEAYVATDSDSTNNSYTHSGWIKVLDQSINDSSNVNNRYRLKATLGPIRNFIISPYIDYTIMNSTSSTRKPLAVPAVSPNNNETDSTTTELVVPASYKLRISDKIDFSFTDNYRSRTVDNNKGETSTSSTNNAVFRLSIPRLTKSTSFNADATFNTSSTDTTSTSMSAYTARLGWNDNPHRLDANLSYQTGKDTPSTSSVGLQYALNLALKKVTLNFQATYNYSVTQGANQPKSTAQTLFMLLSVRN